MNVPPDENLESNASVFPFGTLELADITRKQVYFPLKLTEFLLKHPKLLKHLCWKICESYMSPELLK